MFALLVSIVGIGSMNDSSSDDGDDSVVVREWAVAEKDGHMGSKFNTRGIAKFDFKI
jgi:hypothetical protein